MDQNLKTKWVSALRSDEYVQGHRRLATVSHDNSVSYCCLGVLCEVAGIESNVEEVKAKNPGFSFRSVYYGDHMVTSPEEELLKQWGISEEAIEILMSMNDSDNKSFAEIADYIERNL